MRRSLPLRRATAALVVPLAFATLTACGSDSGDNEPSGSTAAAEPSVQAGDEVTVADFMDSLEEAFEGATTAHVTMENDGEFAMSSEGDVDYSASPPEMKMTIDNDLVGGEMETILVDGVMYMKAPQMGGDKYLKMDVSEATEGMGDNLADQMDPRKALGEMEKAVTSVTYVGEEDVDGEEMVRYTLLIDTETMVGKDGAGAAGMPAELSYDIWFDEDGLFRRTEMDMGEKAGSMVMTLSDWGKSVSIEAPPADQVTEMPNMPSMPSAPPSAAG